MNSQRIKAQIKLYLSRFETLVRISSFSGEYDINKHSENLLIPLLRKVYGWDLINANIEEKNTKSIDLVDLKSRIAIQVSSDNKIDKVKSTIYKFLSSKYKGDIDVIYFYSLVPKQKSYSADAIYNATKGRINFNIKEHIIDSADLYEVLQGITDIEKINEIESFLQREFSDFVLSEEITIHEYENFKEKYKKSCINNYTRLNFFGLSIPNKPREILLYSLFVKPEFSQVYKLGETLFYNEMLATEGKRFLVIGEGEDESHYFNAATSFYKSYIGKYTLHSHTLNFSDLFNISNHLVLLGDPGAGKSSLVKYSICKLIEEDYDVFSNREVYGYVPYRIELYKYNQFKKKNNGGFFDFIHRNIIEEFQVVIDSKKMLQIIEKFPAIIFFDGLDEIFDIQERLQIRNDIENFVQQHPTIKSIVTSRYESYEEVKLSEEIYFSLAVNDFNDSQIKEYVEKWYSIEEKNEFVKEQETKDCIEQLKAVDSQLKHNPLLLSLILILYRNEQGIPTSKLDIYEGCSQTLIEHRDKKEKKLDLELKISHKVSVFSNLAFWQFSREVAKTEFKIDYSIILNFITNYLIEKGEFEDRNEAEDAAIQFLDYAKLRSIYFENKFTHKTFYEYFTANYIFSNYYSSPNEYESFLKLVESNIGLSSWAVILELLICRIDKGQIEYKVIDGIVDHLLQIKPYETCTLFSTIMPYLRALSPAKTRDILTRIVDYILEISSSDKSKLDSSRLTLMEKFIILIRIKKLRETVIGIFDRKFELDEAKSRQYYQLIFELQVLNSGLSESLSKYENFKTDDEKNFIIGKIKWIYDENAVMDVLDEFIRKFGRDSIFSTYVTDFRLPVFNDKSYFNWLELLLYNQKGEKDKVIEVLSKYGFKRKALVEMLEKIIVLESRQFNYDILLGGNLKLL